uniref:Uncharacterized protein n=1 Tax=Aegilops tauschii subsp. strangulata TaxID=200361 RepID=A0A453AJV3_AEGTS
MMVSEDQSSATPGTCSTSRSTMASRRWHDEQTLEQVSVHSVGVVEGGNSNKSCHAIRLGISCAINTNMCYTTFGPIVMGGSSYLYNHFKLI